MTLALDKTDPDGQGCGRRGGHGDGEGHGLGHGEGGRCCGGRRHHEQVPLSRDEEIAVLERQIADSKVRLDELRRG